MDFSALTNFDYVLLAFIGAGMITGLFKGFSGHLGTFTGLVAGLAVGYFCYAFAIEIADELDIEPESMERTAAVAIDFAMGLITFGFVRIITTKFVSFLMPQPMNAILGGIIGTAIVIIGIGATVGTGIIRPSGDVNAGIFPADSVIIKNVAMVVDAYTAGAAD